MISLKVYQGTIFQLEDAKKQAESNQDLELLMAIEASIYVLQNRISLGQDKNEVRTV